MNWNDFETLVFNQDFCFLIILFTLSNIIIFYNFYKESLNIFDPFNIMLLNISSCITLLIYLFFKKYIEMEYFIQLVSIDLVFLLSLKISLKRKISYIFKNIKNKDFFKIYYIVHSFFFLVVIFFFLKNIGLELLYNKIEVFNTHSMIRFFIRYLIPGQISLVFIKRELYLDKKKCDFLILSFGIIASCLMGSKIAVLTFIMNIYITLYLINEVKEIKTYSILKKISILFLIISFLGVLFFFGVVNKTKDFLWIAKAFILRIFNAGDIFYMVYVNNNIDKISGISLYDYYIYNLIGPILRRIVELPEKIYPGFQIIEVVYGIKTQAFGPNTRFEYVWQSNLGYLGIIGGIITGFIYGLIRKVRSKNFIGIQIISILLVSLEGLTSDFGLIAGQLLSSGIVVTTIFIISCTIFYLKMIILIKN